MRNIIQLLEEKSKPQDIEIIALNFEPKEVSPVISKDTLDLHYGKLAHGYAERYNNIRSVIRGWKIKNQEDE